MNEQEHDALEQALLSLQEELGTFEKVKAALSKSIEELEEAKRECEELKVEQQKSARDLIDSTTSSVARVIDSATASVNEVIKSTAASMSGVVESTKQALATVRDASGQSREVSTSLIALAEIIKSVNFPERLGKIDTSVATLASTLSNLQGTTASGFRDVRDKVGDLEDKVDGRFESVSASMEAIGKRQKVLLVLLSFNTGLLAVGIVLYVLIRFGVVS